MREGQKTFTARRLRKDETLAEKRLWEQLRNRTLEGHKFVRQSPVGPYIADFMCRETRLVVEADGATHSTPEERARDRARTDYLNAEGYCVLRFQNDEIINGMDEVLSIIRSALARLPSPPPSRRDGSPSSPAGGRGRGKNTNDRAFVFSRATGEEADPLRSNGGDEGMLMQDAHPFVCQSPADASALARYPSPPPSLHDGSPSSPASGRGHKEEHR